MAYGSLAAIDYSVEDNLTPDSGCTKSVTDRNSSFATSNTFEGSVIPFFLLWSTSAWKLRSEEAPF